MQKKSILVLACCCLLLPAAALAGGYSMNPGKWQFTTTVTMPMLPAPQVSTNTECVSKEEAERDPLANLVDVGNCTITKKEMHGANLDFEMECNEKGMTSKGKGHFSAHGNTVSGSMEMSMEMPKMEGAQGIPGMPTGPMKITTSWKGERIGACD